MAIPWGLEVYHYACQLMSAAILPLATTVAFFSWEVVRIWTGDPAKADHTYILVPILMFAMTASALVHFALRSSDCRGMDHPAHVGEPGVGDRAGTGMILGARFYGAEGVA